MVHQIQENLKGLKLQFLFEASVSANPDKIAVAAGDGLITYSELNIQAKEIARKIQAMGIKKGEMVGVGIHRSINLATAIMGTLISGAVYVPMDPKMPNHRLEYICRDAGIKTILTHTKNASVFETLNIRCRLLLVDGEIKTQSMQTVNCPDRAKINESGPAYVIYTSGSTGNPRGVVISHESLCRFLSSATIDLGIMPGDTYLYMASVSYAVSVRQMFVPLCCGATVVMPLEEEILNPLNLFQMVKKEAVTVMDVVPSYWRTLQGVLENQPPDVQHELLDNKLRMIVSVGEPLTPDLPTKWKNTFRHKANVVNIFGQTETTGYVAYHHVTAEDLTKEINVPIGRPRSNTRLMILDEGLNAVQTGELYIDNASLAEGYLNDPEYTASKFVPYSGAVNPKRIIYRTGDRVSRDEDGTLKALGRNDNRVKINGIRIELEEIETALNRLPGVREAAVIYYSKENRLSAYIVPTGNAAPSVGELREHLEKKIPSAVIPHRFCFMERMPKTVGGKLDRMKLKSETTDGDGKEEKSCECDPRVPNPSDKTGAILLQLWRKHLGNESIGLEDNYFEQGGDSLRAVALFDTISREFQKNIPIATLIEAPTIAKLAAVIDAKTGTPGAVTKEPSNALENEEKNVTVIPLKKGSGKKTPVFCLHGVGGGVMFYRDLVNRMAMDADMYGIQVPEYTGTIDDIGDRNEIYMTFDSLEEMAEHHLKEIRRIQPEGPYRLMGYSSGGIVAYEIARQLDRQKEKVSHLVLVDTCLPLNASCSTKQSTAYICFRFLKNLPAWLIDFCRDPENRKRLRRRFIKMTGNPSHLWYDMKNQRRRELMQQQVKLVRAYCPGTYHGDVTLLRSQVQDLLKPKPKDYGWRRYVAGRINIVEIPGNHRSVLKEPNIRKTAEKLSRCLR